MEWKAEGNCLGVDPELMYPTRHDGSDKIAAAKAVCSGCQVREECLEHALATGEKFGIWGGLTERERRTLRRERRLALA